MGKCTKKKVYQTLFESHLLYMNVIWGTASDKVLKPLQTIQNRALRSVFNLDKLTNRVQMYSHLVENCLPIRAINFLMAASFLFKNLHGNIQSNIRFPFVQNRRGRSSNQRELQYFPSRTHYGHKSITSMGVKIFNSIPVEIKNLKHSAAFKWALRCHIRNEDFLSSCFSNEFLQKYC